MGQIIIGRKDRADLPDFGLSRIQVKIDTGAYSCSVDCRSAKLVEINGVQQLEVIFLNTDRPEYSGEKYYFTEFVSKKVTSSTGNSQIRFFIHGRIVLFGKEFTTLFSLSKRSGMKSPVLIGRKLLNNNFIVDSSKVYLSNKLRDK